MSESDRRQPIDDLDSHPTARIARLSRRLRHGLDQLLEPFGLTAVQFALLQRLAQVDGLVQADLGRRMAIEPATLTGIVQRLERDGWVRRDCDPDNRRLQRVWLTEKARAAMPALRRVQSRRRRCIFSGFSPEDMARLEELLERMEANLR
jgi:DNA-binding MarR family transcriptional regulator